MSAGVVGWGMAGCGVARTEAESLLFRTVRGASRSQSTRGVQATSCPFVTNEPLRRSKAWRGVSP
jgi:hypothetical protein